MRAVLEKFEKLFKPFALFESSKEVKQHGMKTISGGQVVPTSIETSATDESKPFTSIETPRTFAASKALHFS